ncbi:lipopolysaccharide assembly protein LapB [Neptuniibacter sp. 1_MG-2023]|uniref:tetratricopeptide repeat protein n=1 Tax=Neptuniibacter sp. 1_MG-2023 TaxID=3062662 RepID=UPI0026E41299|nr:tetratricopeptide repeat protein [Neptuniibacter sp. 1_MG-2023]MDO6594597.1 tetratricopeptide repeat protein [Neptuniibacter sp. 1_MG-2023]
MSLVNDMLRDLEQRNESATQVPGQQSAVKAAQYVEEETGSKAPRITLWLIGLVAVLTTCWLLWHQIQKTQTYADTKGLSTASLDATDSEEQQDSELSELSAGERLQGSSATDEPLSVIPAPKNAGLVSINDIKWAGADFGGDLVVRLDGDADIQVLNQKDNSIVIAIDDAVLRTTLPSITNNYIKRLDIEAEPDRNRTLLTLTTNRKSQFSFRVQTSPTTLILGVIPDEAALVINDPSDVEAVEITDIGVSTIATPLTVISVDSEKDSIRSSAELQVNLAEEFLTTKPVVSKPVTKSSNALTDRQFAKRARRMINEGKLDEAESLLTKAIAQEPSKAEQSRVLLATLLLSKGETASAQMLIEKSRDLHPYNSDLKKLQARIWMSENKSSQSVDLLSADFPLLETDQEYHELLASAYQQDGKPDESARIYFQLLQLNNSIPRWWIGMGYALEQVKRYADARNAYQSALQIPTIDSRLKSYASQRIQALAGR